MAVTIDGTTGISAPSASLVTPLPSTSGGTGVQTTVAFSALGNNTQTLTASVWTKINFPIKEFDTTGTFDNVTNMRFQPTVAGYYLVSGGFRNTTIQSMISLMLRKTNVEYKEIGSPVNGSLQQSNYGSCIVSLNGSTDFIELFAIISNTQAITNAYFQAIRIGG